MPPQEDKKLTEAETKEMMKIRFKQQKMAERRDRILNARRRVIGVDTIALDQQVAVKNAARENERRSDDLEYKRNNEIERILSAAAQEEMEMKKFNDTIVRKSWDQSIREKEELRKSQSLDPDVDLDNCGMASAIKFAGEDSNSDERLRLQKQQMREWTNEQVGEKLKVSMMMKADDEEYFETLKSIDMARRDAEIEEEAVRAAVRRKFAEENIVVMKSKQAERAAELHEFRTVGAGNLSIAYEDFDLAKDSNGRIIRRDMFKGNSKAQQRTIINSNTQNIEAKRLRDREEKELDVQWAMQNAIASRALEQANADDKRNKEIQREEYLQVLNAQRARQSVTAAEWEAARKGSITNGFFNAFGTSGR